MKTWRVAYGPRNSWVTKWLVVDAASNDGACRIAEQLLGAEYHVYLAYPA